MRKDHREKSPLKSLCRFSSRVRSLVDKPQRMQNNCRRSTEPICLKQYLGVRLSVTRVTMDSWKAVFLSDSLESNGLWRAAPRTRSRAALLLRLV